MPEKTHWKKMTNPNYMGDYSIPEGCDLIATIDYVAQEKVTGVGGKTEVEVVAHFSDGNKPLILNKTNMKLMKISEKELLRFIDESEKAVDVDSDIPRQQSFVTPEVNPDSISDPLGWISKLM